MTAIRTTVEIEFAPDTAPEVWSDVTPYVLTTGADGSEVSISHGRADEITTVSPSQMSFVLDNTTRNFTPGANSSSVYGGVNITTGRRVRLTHLTSVNANLMPDSGFATATLGRWVAGPTTDLAISTYRAQADTWSALITWPTGGAATGAQCELRNLRAGVVHTLSLYVFVPVGDPAVTLRVVSPATAGTTSAVTVAWTRLSVTWTPTSATAVVQLTAAASTATDQTWFDSVQVEEAATATAYVASSAVSSTRFTGFIDEWDVNLGHPGVHQTVAVSASDLMTRLALRRSLRSILEEEILQDSPWAYYPLGESSGVSAAADTSTYGRAPLVVTSRGGGGNADAFTFGSGTGPGTDGLSAPMFAPTSTVIGKYLTGALSAAGATPSTGYGGYGYIAECWFNSTALSGSPLTLKAASGDTVTLTVTAAGKLNATAITAGVSKYNITSAATVAATAGTIHAVLSVTWGGGGNSQIALYINGTSSASTNIVSTGTFPVFNTVYIGGGPASELFTGTVSHVAVYDRRTAPTALSTTRITAHYNASITGFTGESSHTRFARIAGYGGLTGSELSLETGLSTMGLQQITGRGLVEVLSDIVDAEHGIMFVNGEGVLVFQSRAHRYNQVTEATFAVDGDEISGELRYRVDDQFRVTDVTATRPGGPAIRVVSSNEGAYSYRQTFELALADDNQVTDAAWWRINTYAVPVPRCSAFTVDLATAPHGAADVPTIAGRALSLGISDQVALSGITTPTSDTLLVEGWRETWSVEAHTITFNPSPPTVGLVYIIEGTGLSGKLDGGAGLAY